jgi:hypothetical protein
MNKLIFLFLFFIFINAWAVSEKEAGYNALMKKDYVTAIKLLRPFAEAGDKMEQFNLGMWYYEGLGVKQDYAEAAKWYRLAAEQGDILAKYSLGIMYSNGKGVIQDYKEAFSLFKAGAEAGCTMCQVALGITYEYGEGTPKDLVLAYMWYNIAAADTHPARAKYQENALINRNLVAGRLSSEEIAKGQELSRTCLAANLKNCGDAKTAVTLGSPVAARVVEDHPVAASPQKEIQPVVAQEAFVSLGNGPIYLILKAAVAVGAFFILTIGIWKTSRSTPGSYGRWIGAYGGSLAIISMRPYSAFPNMSEFLVAAIALFVMLFLLGFIIGFGWRKFRPAH